MFNWAASPVNNSVHSPNFVSIHFPDSQTCSLSEELHPQRCSHIAYFKWLKERSLSKIPVEQEHY
jgi:hypothetical protein